MTDTIKIPFPPIEDKTCEIRGCGTISLLSFFGQADAIELPAGEWAITGMSDTEVTLTKYRLWK